MNRPLKKLEILGQLNSLKQPDFFEKLILEGAANVLELLLDSILDAPQLDEIIKGLQIVSVVPKNETELNLINKHKL